jgi:hypothetical protein
VLDDGTDRLGHDTASAFGRVGPVADLAARRVDAEHVHDGEVAEQHVGVTVRDRPGGLGTCRGLPFAVGEVAARVGFDVRMRQAVQPVAGGGIGAVLDDARDVGIDKRSEPQPFGLDDGRLGPSPLRHRRVAEAPRSGPTVHDLLALLDDARRDSVEDESRRMGDPQ